MALCHCLVTEFVGEFIKTEYGDGIHYFPQPGLNRVLFKLNVPKITSWIAFANGLPVRRAKLPRIKFVRWDWQILCLSLIGYPDFDRIFAVFKLVPGVQPQAIGDF